jgi:hypothetical protein
MSVIWLSRLLIPAEVSRALYDDLKENVARCIIPKLEQAGFRQGPHPFYRKPTSKESAYNPHGIFKRTRQSREELIEILYDERRYPEFYLYLGFAPHLGVRVRGRDFLPENMGVAESPLNFSLSSSSRSFQPFAVIWPLAGAESIHKILGEAEKALPQVFDWFDHGIVGPNLFGGPEPTVNEISGDRAE